MPRLGHSWDTTFDDLGVLRYIYSPPERDLHIRNA